MTKKCSSAYLKLINALLSCPNGRELEVLNANSDLVDANLVQMMQQEAAKLAERGEQNAAHWLRNFATHLTAAVGNLSMWMTQKAEAERLRHQGDMQYKSGHYKTTLQFWEQALSIYQLVQDRYSEAMVLGNLGNIYALLGDCNRAIDYQQKLLSIVREFKDRCWEQQALGNIGVPRIWQNLKKWR